MYHTCNVGRSSVIPNREWVSGEGGLGWRNRVTLGREPPLAREMGKRPENVGAVSHANASRICNSHVYHHRIGHCPTIFWYSGSGTHVAKENITEGFLRLQSAHIATPV